MTLAEATKNLFVAMQNSLRNGSGWFAEADSDLNDASRALIAAYHSHHGGCYLGNVNPWNKEGPYLWSYDGESLVRNFEASFVVPAYDPTLEEMIRQHRLSGKLPTLESVGQITDYIAQIGGEHLFWS